MKYVLVAVLVLAPLAPGQGCGWAPLAGGADGAVLALEIFDDGGGPVLVAAGDFGAAGGMPSESIAAWDGSSWSALGGGVGSGAGVGGDYVASLVSFDDGSGPALYAGGNFSTAGGVPALNVARWDGTVWAPLGAGLAGTVLDLAVFDDGTGPALYAAGMFLNAAGDGLLRWDGTTWAPVGGSLFWVFGLTVFDDGAGPALHAGGFFTVAGGVAARNVARWDGSSWSPLGPGIDHWILSLESFDDGTGPALHACGGTTFSDPASSGFVYSWDGSAWSVLGGGIGGPAEFNAVSLAVFDDGGGDALYAGGNFTTAGGRAASGLARWDGNAWAPVGGGVSSTDPALTRSVSALITFDGGGGPALHVGGQFTHAGAVAVASLASVACPTTLSLSVTQPGGSGAGVTLTNTGMTPGLDYHNIFSFEPCPNGAGSGPYLGLCSVDPGLLVLQLLAPLGSPAIHFTAAGSATTWGPFSVPPVTAEALSLHLGSSLVISPVTRFTIQ